MLKKVIKNDEYSKLKIKNYADQYQNTKQIEFNIGDELLYKWIKNNKFQSKFDPDPYVVTKVNGSMITAERHNHNLTRDISED